MSSEIEELRTRVDGLQRLVEALMDYVLVENVRHAPPRGEGSVVADNGLSSIEFVNFHAEELDGSGMPYRWTGPSTVSTLRLQLDRGTQHRLTFSVVSRSLDEARQPIRVYVDGRAADAEVEGGRWTVQIDPNPAIGRLPTIVAIDVGETYCAFEAGQGDDRRHLGIAVAGVVLE